MGVGVTGVGIIGPGNLSIDSVNMQNIKVDGDFWSMGELNNILIGFIHQLVFPGVIVNSAAASAYVVDSGGINGDAILHSPIYINPRTQATRVGFSVEIKEDIPVSNANDLISFGLNDLAGSFQMLQIGGTNPNQMYIADSLSGPSVGGVVDTSVFHKYSMIIDRTAGNVTSYVDDVAIEVYSPAPPVNAPMILMMRADQSLGGGGRFAYIFRNLKWWREFV